MTRTIIIPSKSNIVLPVPDNYIGKRIEVLMYDVAEVMPQPEIAAPALKPSQMRGFLSKDTAEAMQEYIKQSRDEWDTLPTPTF